LHRQVSTVRREELPQLIKSIVKSRVLGRQAAGCGSFSLLMACTPLHEVSRLLKAWHDDQLLNRFNYSSCDAKITLDF
jgi:hypothetical protein